MTLSAEKITEQTVTWIKSVVIDCNFCPFAAKAVMKNSINYIVKYDSSITNVLDTLKEELIRLQIHSDTETSFIIFPDTFENFNDYLGLVKKAERLISKENYDGIFQIASFHPDYCFEGSDENDPANYTNRSIYPMIHILREESLTKALSLYPHPEKIPLDNITYSREKGLKYMQLLRSTCI
ncbi:MAG: DUF1415 domain-containing protein [Bacteroidota bacterium]